MGRRPAFYSPAGDFVQMPHRSQFVGSKTSTAARLIIDDVHELTHWTGPAKRCGRELASGSAISLCVRGIGFAELGAAFLSADHLVKHEPRADHAGTSGIGSTC